MCDGSGREDACEEGEKVMEIIIGGIVLVAVALVMLKMLSRKPLKVLEHIRKPFEDFEYTYRVASTSELEELFKGIKGNSIKRSLLAHIAEEGLTNTEFDFLLKVSDRFTGEDMVKDE